ncbi:hypothetical protein CPB84DRAFT_1812807 [Gymnopilus junonius]|uniref:F-box domain-containing protein n=1 Tax=Gymnopilus junonius TaxID=109634 RepID=A0A9P5TRT2_GYMJU|nr:hypothetical protein CPB84DRAFT_1812807 [Gymnopilus junonius]
MSSPPGDIDNDNTLFQFDPHDCQSPSVSSTLQPELARPLAAATCMSSRDDPHTSMPVVGKGKQRSMPMPIRASTIVHDLFYISSPTTSSSSRAFPSSPSLSPTSSSFSSPGIDGHSRGRNFSGKEREPFPYLPPLSFSDHDLPPTPGPSSYGTYSPSSTAGSPPSPSNGRETLVLPPSSSPSPDSPDIISPNLMRSRSLSNLSRPISPVFGIVSAAVDSQPAFGPYYPQPDPRASLKTKVRSKSSPYPISVLDFIPNASTDIFQPLPIVIVNYFDHILPEELRLSILRALRDSHEQDYLRLIEEGRLSFGKAISSRARWVGRDKGLRELFKLSRVSKGWRSLVLDGELWVDMDLRAFHSLSPAIVVRLLQSAGTFVRKLNLAGHVQLHADALSDITSSLCLAPPHVPSSYTQITKANFQGCTSLTTRALHQFLVRSRSLEILSFKGISAVTNTTCDIVANFCPKLISLNLSRCPNVDGHGISVLTKGRSLLKELRLSGIKYVSDSTMQALGRALPYLEILDLSYCRQLHNSSIEAFVACDRYDDTELGLDTVLVSPRDLGRETNDSGKLKRRVTRLRHLILSSCLLLTDMACSNLAYSVPRLEFLEIAGIGSDLKDAGLIRLLGTTPHIRRLDLEDAIDISDAVLAAITPPPTEVASTANRDAPSNSPKETGYAMQQVNVSYATRITDDAFLSLIRNCTQLTVLEADNTRMGTATAQSKNAIILAVDCRGIHESLVKELSSMTRPRLGWRAYGARKLGYLDSRDDNEEELKIGQDECDEERVVLKTFYSWQTVDAVKAAREKRRKAAGRRSEEVEADAATRSARWWSPGGRRSPRNGGGQDRDRNSPILQDLNNDGCRAM